MGIWLSKKDNTPAASSTPARRNNVRGDNVGSILLADGKITEEQLRLALEARRDGPRDIGQALVSLGFVSDEELAWARAQRSKAEYVEIYEKDVDPGVLALIPDKVLRKHKALPLRVEDEHLVVAMADPANILALEDLKMLSGYPVIPVVATAERISKLLTKLIAGSDQVTGILQDAAGEAEEDGEQNSELDLGEASPDERPVIRLVSSILQHAISDGASDIHIEPRAEELAVRLRVDGVLREVMSIPPKLQNAIIARLKIVANLNIAERRVPQDGRFAVKIDGQKIDMRVSSLPTVYGEKIVLRLLEGSNAAVGLSQLGFLPSVYERFQEVFRRPYGAILVTGPTGSGKSTTLYATLAELNTPEKNIITVEDPVEYRMEGINQVQTNAKVGLTFASALRNILRSDPDIVMIGEIRDFETAKIAVESAMTGHLVLATLHTSNAPGALSRLTDMGVEPFLTSSAVDCVIAQRLTRRLCERCKQPAEVSEETLSTVGFPYEHMVGQANFHKPVGCEHCGGTGYRGRVGVYEMMVVDEEIKDMVLRHASTAEIGRVAESKGMLRLKDDGLIKAAQGLTTIEEVLRTVV